jgi:hypothetical protein
MAFLDFMQEQQASQQQPVAQTSQQQQSQTPSVDKLPSHVKAEAVEAAPRGGPPAVLMDKATQHQAEVRHDLSNRTEGKEALIRNQGDQGKTQDEMSPTDHSKSQTQTQGRMQERGRGMER